MDDYFPRRVPRAGVDVEITSASRRSEPLSQASSAIDVITSDDIRRAGVTNLPDALRHFGGLGLGLAISRAIVELHGGTITASSDGENRGARFVIRLATTPASVAPRDRSAPPAATGAAVNARSLHVLLVEDHPDTAQQLTRLLERAGHEVTWAGSIREAREFLAQSEPETNQRGFNILISDLGLPDGSGHELMRDLASARRMPGIALSGYGMKADIEHSMEAGFSRHITKPVDWQELKVAIQKIAAEQTS